MYQVFARDGSTVIVFQFHVCFLFCFSQKIKFHEGNDEEVHHRKSRQILRRIQTLNWPPHEKSGCFWRKQNFIEMKIIFTETTFRFSNVQMMTCIFISH